MKHEKTEEFRAIKAELDKIRQKEYYIENKKELNEKRRPKEPAFRVIKERITLLFN